MVALVVTIVILLILAGITIGSLTGDNGIIGKAGEAKEQTELAGIREELALIWNETQIETVGKNLSNNEIANILEEKLQENDPDATVKYQSLNNTYEITYKDHMFELSATGSGVTTGREDVVDDIEEAWDKVDQNATKEEQAEQLEDELQKIDPDSTAEYNPDTGKIEINHGGYESEIDEDGNIEVIEPDNTDIDTDGDGKPDINIDTDGDGEPDINIDTNGDRKPDINIDTNGDGKPDINIDTNGDGEADVNIDTDGDGEPDINIDEDGDGIPEIYGEIEYTVSWTEEGATVNLTTTSGYYIEYSIDNNIYTRGNTVEGVQNGSIIYARLTNGTYSGEAIQIEINDTDKPEVKIEEGTITTNSIEITAIGTDKGSGIKEYRYYISSTGEIGSEPTGKNNTGEYTFTELDQNTEYTIKVEVEDYVGNINDNAIKVSTELIPTAEEGISREVTWNSDGTVKVILTTETEFDILYSTDRSDWKSYTGELTIQSGETIYICLTDGRNKGADYEIDVTDNEGPIVTITRESVTANAITVKVDAKDQASGMGTGAKYNYYIKEDGEEEYRLIGENQTSTSYTYGGLKAQTLYNIRVTTSDILGNPGEGTLDVTTNDFTYVTGNISVGNTVWANKVASIILTNNTENQMEYKIIPSGQEISLDGEWTRVEEKSVTVGNLKDGDMVIARLTDGVNVTSGYATANIEDEIRPSIEVTGNPVEWTNQSVTLTVNAQDNESGLQEQAYSFDGGLSWQSENTKVYDKNTSGIIIQVRDEAGNISSETINIDKIDKDGPVIDIETEATSNMISISVNSITDAGIGVDNNVEVNYYLTTNNAELETMEPSRKTTERTVEFTSLTQNTTYYIKVEAKDNLGNIGSVYRTVSTGSLDASSSDINITDPVWENKAASVTITNNSTYNMEYQIVKNGETFDQNGSWILLERETETTTQVTDLLNGDTVYVRLTDGINASGTIIKKIEDMVNPTIEVTGNPVEWTNQSVTLTVNAQDNESGLQTEAYSFDGGLNWQSENTKTYEQNTQDINIQVRDEAGNIVSKTVTIDRIDKQGPNIVLQQGDITTKSATIEIVSAIDSGVGTQDNPTYIYYIKQANGEYSKEGEGTENSNTFDNLKANTTYTIKVEVADILGNIGEKTVEITTRNLIYQQEISFPTTVWNNGIATVTAVNSNNEYDMEYQIGKNGAGINLTGTWTRVSEKTVDIGNLEDGDKVYARLTDGVNVTSLYGTCNVINDAKETYTEQELANQTTRGAYDILGISVANNELRLKINEKQEKANTYNYYYKTINDKEYKLISTNTNYDNPAVIKDIVEGATYKVKVLVTDEDGNITRSENTATMIALGQAEKGQTYTDNRTYIDDNGYTVSVPEDFSISSEEGETNKEDGVVLKDASGNEYVWIPVNDAIYDGVTDMPTSSGTASRTYKPMAIRQSGYDNYYEGIIYTFNSINSWRNTSNTGVGKSSYREPSVLTNNSGDGYTWDVGGTTGILYDAAQSNYKDILGFESVSDFGRYLASNYNNMVTSVDSYGGFYVGRYETTQDEDTVVASKANSRLLTETNWYNMYLYQDSQRYNKNPYYNTSSVTSNMIWGSQWDAMLNYILTGKDKNKVTTSIGSQKGQQSNSGQDANDVINNIYDLSSNVYEWTGEANNINYRVYRGGSYDSSITGNASSKRQVQPTDQGPVFGTRMALSIKSTNDVIGPVATINNTVATSNTITVEVSAEDRETGVDRYRYYISTDTNSWGQPKESNTNTNTFTGLLQGTTYYIKVEAVDGAGNVGEGAQTNATTEQLGNVAKEAITRTQMYGADGSGIVELSLSEEYTSSGYYIEYQVTDNVDMSGSWTKGNTISNLSNGQKIFATVFDGNNRSTDYYEETVEGLEEYGYIDANGDTYTEEEAVNAGVPTTYDTTIEYTDSQGNKATIPAGFQVGITNSVNTINNGLVIKDKSGNEFVWVPVENAVETDNSTTSSEKAMARLQSGSSNFYEGILYNFSGTTSTKMRSATALGTSTYREPTIVTSGADYTWNVANGSAKGVSYDALEDYYKYMSFGATSGVQAFNTYSEFGQYMNEQYTNMIQSVENYGGFYIGRYETSLDREDGSKQSVVQSQIGKNPIYNRTWYRDYYFQDSNINQSNPYHTSTSVTSSMVWGSQWDAMLNWMLKDENTKDFVTRVTGNHTGTRSQTGNYTDDLAKNIFDLASNVGEWTQEGSSTAYREIRGGYSVAVADKYGIYSASSRNTYWRPPTLTYVQTNPTNTGGDASVSLLGSRMALYIKNVEDTTQPVIEETSTKSGTNNIEVTVNARDDESGIDKYRYSVSYKNFENDDTFNESTDIISVNESYGSTYAVQGLLQGQTYYVKVEVINGAGLKSTSYTGAVMTERIELQEGDVTVEKTWGKDGEGKAYFTLSKEFENEGYSLQHQVVSSGGSFNDADGSWTQSGDTVTGLKTGDTIYTRIYDGVNKVEQTSYKTTNVTELETFSNTYQETTVYEDDENNQAYIPEGFKVGTSSLNNNISNGLVIEDEVGNQYVWIPVENVIYDGQTPISATYKPMVRYQNGYNEGTEQYFEGIYYSFSGTTSTGSTGYRLGQSSYREPSLVTGSEANYSWIFTAGNNYDTTNYNKLSGLGITSVTQMGEYLNDKYTEMVESVEKYGGYYVGRYETSSWTTDTWSSGGTNAENTGEIVKSVPNATPMATTNWYSMYQKQNSEYSSNPYNSSESVTTTMISGSQWDTMLNFILEGTDKEKIKEVTGNHTGTRAKTGQFGSDIMNNIFDLSSNVREWTSEAYSSSYRAGRGSFYGVADTSAADYRDADYTPTATYYGIGSRLSLYIR